MVVFLLKVSFIIGIALLFYKLVLQQESFFGTNRLYFIFCLGLAFVLPYIQLPEIVNHQGFIASIFDKEPVREVAFEERDFANAGDFWEPSSKNTLVEKQGEPVTEVEDFSAVSLEQSKTGAFSSGYWLLLLYLFGVAVFCLNLIVQVGNLFLKIYRNPDKIYDGDYVIVNTAHNQAPCSFFKYIFIHPDNYDLETYEQIIAHEKTHVNLRHSWDLLLAEIAVIVLWFNPFIWIYKREIEKNLEFQTDSLLLEKKQVQKDRYQMNLLQIAASDKPLTITINYNQSLLKQRIMMMNAKKSTLNRYWKYAFTAPLFLGTLLLLNEPAKSQAPFEDNTQVALPQPSPSPEPGASPSHEPVSEPRPTPSPNIMIRQQEDISQGFWYGHHEENQYCIDFRGNKNNGRWSISDCFDKNTFQKKEDGIFSMTNEAGVLKLFGDLDKDVSQGKYEFTKDASFEKYLSESGIENSNQNLLFHLHLNQVDRKYIDFVKSQFKKLNGDQLLALVIHDVDRAYIEGLEQAGFKNLSADKIVAAKIHDVNPTTIKEIRALGFGNMGIDKIIELKIHDVDARFIDDLKKSGFSDITLDEVVQAKIHDLNPESIKEIKALGFKDLGMRKMMELKIHDVNAEFIKELKAAGFNTISLDEALQAKIHDLSPSTVKEIKALGFGDLSLQKMIELQIHNVNANYIQSLKSAGFDKLSLEQIFQAKIHDVDPSTIKEMKALGFENLDFEKIVEAKIHGVSADYLNDLKRAGFTGISIDKAIQAKMHGVDSNFIKDAKANGYNLKTLDEYIQVKIHGLARNNNRDQE